jgi:nucleotide-binding universal stress UspA family protein
MHVERILVGLDGSVRERNVLDVAQDLAERFAAELILYRAVGVPPEIPDEAWQNPEIPVEEYLLKQARAALQDRLQTLPEKVKARTRLEVTTATAWEGLCQLAEAERAGLIVIGSHGYGTLDRLLGTTAARVANHAPCSVFVVRSGSEASEAHDRGRAAP